MVAPIPPGPRRGVAFNRYWGYAGRPYAGCGCLYSLLLLLVAWFLLSLFIDALWFFW